MRSDGENSTGADSFRSQPVSKRALKLAVASLLCSLPGAIVAIIAFVQFLFVESSRKQTEDLIELSVLSVWLFPLICVGVVLGLKAQGYRFCLLLPLVYLLAWLGIMWVEQLKF